jgi:hypothetical protein
MDPSAILLPLPPPASMLHMLLQAATSTRPHQAAARSCLPRGTPCRTRPIQRRSLTVMSFLTSKQEQVCVFLRQGRQQQVGAGVYVHVFVHVWGQGHWVAQQQPLLGMNSRPVLGGGCVDCCVSSVRTHPPTQGCCSFIACRFLGMPDPYGHTC